MGCGDSSKTSMPTSILKIPYVKQEIGGMCGPTCLSMLFKYYGENECTPEMVGKRMIKEFPNEKRV